MEPQKTIKKTNIKKYFYWGVLGVILITGIALLIQYYNWDPDPAPPPTSPWKEAKDMASETINDIEEAPGKVVDEANQIVDGTEEIIDNVPKLPPKAQEETVGAGLLGFIATYMPFLPIR